MNPERRKALVERLLAGIARRLGGAEVKYIGPDEPPRARVAEPSETRRVRVKLIGMLRTLDDLEEEPGDVEQHCARLRAIEEALDEIEREIRAQSRPRRS